MASRDKENEALTAESGYNFKEWYMPWQKALILFRHMLANSTFEAQIDDVPAITEETTEFESLEGQHYMGDYAPQGIRLSKYRFLSEYRITKMDF